MKLLEWYIIYRKNRDLVRRAIVGITHVDNTITITLKTRSEICIVQEEPQSIATLADKATTVVMSNSMRNIELLLKEWKTLAQKKELSLVFANPMASGEKQWVIKPYIHDRVSDNASLKLGLTSIAQSVEMTL